MTESSGFFDRHVEPECFKLSDVPLDRTLRVPLVEVVGPEFFVRDAVAHDEVRDFENLVSDRDNRLFVSSMPRDPMIPGLQRGPVLAHGAERGLDQGPPQISVPFPRFAAVPLAGTFVLTGTHGAPATQVPRGRKSAHVATGFSHDADGAD